MPKSSELDGLRVNNKMILESSKGSGDQEKFGRQEKEINGVLLKFVEITRTT